MHEKPVIQLLSDQVINKIAAGEVVERPASVMKELFENSLDAGASQVDVEVIRGGRQLISITDNGCGMDRDQALLSIERHATSKIKTEADIENIHTMGFRGEALAAISSVSRFTLITRPEEELSGTEILIAGGKMQGVDDIGCPVGTRIEIRNLFFNVPARRKFLRAEQTELSHIRQLFLVMALAHPSVGMSLRVDERMVYSLPMSGNMEDRISELYNHGFFEQLLPVNYADAEYKIVGYAGLPQTGRKDRQDQYIFVNGRPAAAPVVFHALNEAYHSLMAKGRYPALFLFIDMEPSLVDVNVHPTKKEVRFRKPNQLRDSILAALKQALTFGHDEDEGEILPSEDLLQHDELNTQKSDTNDPEPIEEGEPIIQPEKDTTPKNDQPAQRSNTESIKKQEPAPLPRAPAPAPPQAVRPRIETQKKMDDLLVRPELITKNNPKPEISAPQTQAKKTSAEETSIPVAKKSPPQSPWGWCRIVGQLNGNYVILETEDGYVLMEPRAAHERVLFEKFMKAVHQNNVPRQGLLAPETVDLLPTDAQTVRTNMSALHELGFGVSEFGGDTFIIDALPVYVQDQPAETLLIEIAHELEKAGKKRGARELVQEQIAQAACLTAVRTRDQLSDKAIEKLVSDLAQTEMPYTSPRGRPTLIYTSFSELDRKFSRD